MVATLPKHIVDFIAAGLAKFHERSKAEHLASEMGHSLGVLADVRGPAPQLWPIHGTRPIDKSPVFIASTGSLPDETTRPWWTGTGAALLWQAVQAVRPDRRALDYLHRLTVPKDPAPEIQTAARKAAGDGADGAAVDRLARATLERLRELTDRLESDPNAKEPDAPVRAVDGLLWADTLALGFLRETGQEGRRHADQNEPDKRAAWQAFNDAHPAGSIPTAAELADLWRALLPDRDDGTAPIIRALARAVWADVENGRVFSVWGVRYEQDEYAKVPKTIGAIECWAPGGLVRVATKIDDDVYATQPGILTSEPTLRLIPRSWDLLPPSASGRRPHQMALAIEFRGNETVTLAEAAVKQSVAIFSGLTGKLLLLMMAGTPNSKTVRGTLGELARYLYPGRRIQQRELIDITKALLQAKSFYLVFEDETAVQCFDIRAALDPNRARPDQVVGWALGRHFEEALRQQEVPKALNGDLVLNISGAMRIPSNQTTELRLYVKSAAAWNDAFIGKGEAFEPGALKAYRPEEWAAYINALSQRTVEFLQDRKAGRGGNPIKQRRVLSEQRKRLEAAAQYLESKGLVRIAKVGQSRTAGLRILPTDAHIEARKKIRHGEARPLDTIEPQPKCKRHDKE